MAAKKPTKQQIAQAKARAGGNTTSKTTPARMAKGAKDIALFAATIAGPGKVAKVATTAAKAARASSPVSKRVAANKIDRAEQMLKLNKDIKTKEDAAVWATHPGAASFKSNQRLVKQGKWSSPKQIARYQRQEAKAEIKSEKRALKAANKPVKNKDASVMNRNNQYARQAILNEKPARPNRVRGGSMKSKQNWPEGMKKPKPSLADPKIAEAKRKADAAARLKRLDYNSRNGIF